ncbi:hypothetical protein [Deinococcus ruber]|uniref:Alpha/beta hydrolase n=1 Tax=Deinococcus ruber TaxID=1848197 RepID=A0A918FD43_9DEIO|nr:hypothetical protein [Deinococcus ruber]GGR23484.1 hypothetical protein GCM10008957_39200 [Deinococcus ruber]
MPEPDTLILIHGFSAEGRPGDIDQIYGSLPAALRTLPVLEVNLGRYVSLDDSVDLEDVTLAFDRVVAAHPGLLQHGFNAVTHSTGALVIRNWLRRRSQQPSPLRRLIHLAGAHFGSGWAHLGRSQLARWVHLIGQGSDERGLGVLSDLEFGSGWAIDLHLHFLTPGHAMLADYGVLEACLVGCAPPPSWAALPFRYGHEAGSDGVVRVAASNVNVTHLRIGPARPAGQVDWAAALASGSAATALRTGEGPAAAFYTVLEENRPASVSRPEVPFAVLDHCAHVGSETGILTGRQPQATVLRLVSAVLNAQPTDSAAVCEQFAAATAQTYARVSTPEHGLGASVAPFGLGTLGRAGRTLQRQYDPHAQLIVRTWDHLDRPLPGCSVHLNSFGGTGQPQTLINDLFEDTHLNSLSSNTLTFYLRTHRYDPGDGRWQAVLPEINGIDLEIDAPPGAGGRVLVVPLRLRLDSATLERWIEPHRTTVMDVQLLRLPSDDTFELRPSRA